MTSTILLIHSLFRWFVLLAGLLVVARVVAGSFDARAWTRGEDRAAALFTIALDIQLLIGLALYGLSPITTAAIRDIASAMKKPEVRYFVAEHPAIMVLAVAAANLGKVLVRRATGDQQKFRRAAAYFALSFGLLLFGIPWTRLAST